MVSREDVESYLLRTEQEFEEVEPGLWVVRMGEDSANLVINHSPPVLVMRVKVLDVPQDTKQCAELYRKLLELNAEDLVHGSYGIEEESVILTDTMELENLDFNEFQASVDSIQMALSGHGELLAPYRNC